MTLELMLYSHDWAPLIGGIQTITTALAEGLAKWAATHEGKVVNVTFVTQTPADGMNDSSLPFRVVRLPNLLKLVSLIHSADVVHLTGLPFLPLVLCLLLRKPTVVEHHGYQSICPNGGLIYLPDQTICPGHFMAGRYLNCIRCNSDSPGLARSLFSLALTFPRRWMARRVSVNVVPSHHIGERIVLPRTQTIYHGIPQAHLRRCSIQNSKTFAFVGRLTTEKGVPVLLRASRSLANDGYDFRVKILGDGRERTKLEKMVEQMDLKTRVKFLGSVKPTDMGEVLSDVIAIVMPSVCEEVAPLVAIERMMEGYPIIASDMAGLAEMVADVALKFTLGDSDALKSCMVRVLQDPGLGTKLGQKAQIRASRFFSEKRMVEEHLRLCQVLLNAGGKNS